MPKTLEGDISVEDWTRDEDLERLRQVRILRSLISTNFKARQILIGSHGCKPLNCLVRDSIVSQNKKY